MNPSPRCTAHASEIMVCLEGRRQSAVERPVEVALDDVNFLPFLIWVFERLEAISCIGQASLKLRPSV